LKFFLERREHEVKWATDWAEAWTRLKQHEFDVVIVDLVLPSLPDSADPDGDSQVLGAKLCKELLAVAPKTKPTIIVYSVRTEEEFRQCARTVGLAIDSVRFFSKRDPRSQLTQFLETLAKTYPTR
jgi:CheY-like chemotaxis protein